MVMTAKVDIKKVILILAGVAALLLALILMLSDAPADTVSTGAPAAGSNDARVSFLEGFGWEAAASPRESGRVKIPKEAGEMFDRYNTLQKAQGYDLSRYAGKTVMRYVYQISNYPGATAPVYATLLVSRNEIIGGDITDTSPSGRIHGFRMPGNAGTQTLPEDPSGTTGPGSSDR